MPHFSPPSLSVLRGLYFSPGGQTASRIPSTAPLGFAFIPSALWHDNSSSQKDKKVARDNSHGQYRLLEIQGDFEIDPCMKEYLQDCVSGINYGRSRETSEAKAVGHRFLTQTQNQTLSTEM